MRIKLIQIDGALPNLALMKLAHWHRARGDEVLVTRRIEPDLFEGPFDRVYASAIFRFSADRIVRFQRCYPQGILGGTGTDSPLTVEEWLHEPSYEPASSTCICWTTTSSDSPSRPGARASRNCVRTTSGCASLRASMSG